MADEPLGRGFDVMSPQLARAARNALSLSHAQLGREIGESAATVMKYELGKTVDDALVGKLRAYFKQSQIRVLRKGGVGRYQFSPLRPDE